MEGAGVGQSIEGIRMSPIAERIAGGWFVMGIVDGYLVRRRYFGYTHREALSLFHQETKNVAVPRVVHHGF